MIFFLETVFNLYMRNEWNRLFTFEQDANLELIAKFSKFIRVLLNWRDFILKIKSNICRFFYFYVNFIIAFIDNLERCSGPNIWLRQRKVKLFRIYFQFWRREDCLKIKCFIRSQLVIQINNKFIFACKFFLQYIFFIDSYWVQ